MTPLWHNFADELRHVYALIYAHAASMPNGEPDVQFGWRDPHDDDGLTCVSATRKKAAKRGRAKAGLPPAPSQRFKSTTTVVVERGVLPEERQAESAEIVEMVSTPGATTGDGGDVSRAGAARRRQNGLHQAATARRLSVKLVKQTRKKIVARERAEEAERKETCKEQTKRSEHDAEDTNSDNRSGVATEDGWLMPVDRSMRRKAKLMRGLRTESVDRLEDDDLNHTSKERSFFKGSQFLLLRPFRRRVVEDRHELLGILSLPQNKRMRKAGIKEAHLASLANVYKDVISNAHRRNEEDGADVPGLPNGVRNASIADKGVRVSSFATTLGISPYLFMRERELVEFIFRTCKVTDKGELESGELERVAKSLHLSNGAFWDSFSQQLDGIVRAQEEGEVVLTLDFFLAMHSKFPMILYPALHMQELVQRRTLGLYTWGRLVDKLDRYVAHQRRLASGTKPCCLLVLCGLKT